MLVSFINRELNPGNQPRIDTLLRHRNYVHVFSNSFLRGISDRVDNTNVNKFSPGRNTALKYTTRCNSRSDFESNALNAEHLRLIKEHLSPVSPVLGKALKCSPKNKCIEVHWLKKLPSHYIHRLEYKIA